MVYLPPHGSSRPVDASAFFEEIHAQIFSYQNDGNFLIMGDVNSRLGSRSDFIEGVDMAEQREIIDHKENAYAEHFQECLISANCLVLNGRHNKLNGCTSIATRGVAFVNYIVMPESKSSLAKDFEVIQPRTLFSDARWMCRYNRPIIGKYS